MVIRRLLRDDRGVSAIEYCLLAALIALGMVTSAQEVGATIATAMHEVGSALGIASGEPGDGKNKGNNKSKDKDKGKKPPK